MTFDEQYDEILRQEFVSTSEPAAAAAEAPVGRNRFSRYGGATVIAVGGVACTAIGALLGGLGGSVGVSPAAVHSLDAAGFPSLPAIAGSSPAAALPTLAKAAAALPTEGLTVTLSHGLSSVAGSNAITSAAVHSVGSATGTETGPTGLPGLPIVTQTNPTTPSGGQPISTPPAAPNLLGSLTQTLDTVVTTLTNLGGLGGSLPAPFTQLVNALTGLGSAAGGSGTDPVSGVVNTVTGLLGAGSGTSNPLAGLLGGVLNPSGLLNTVTSALGAGGGSLTGSSSNAAAIPQTQGTTLHLGSGPTTISGGSSAGTGNDSTTTTTSAAATTHQLTK